jgi:hypothetical protein
MDATSIFDIEVSTLLTSSLHVLARRMIEDIIHPTAESITALTHRQSRGHRKEGENIGTEEYFT